MAQALRTIASVVRDDFDTSFFVFRPKALLRAAHFFGQHFRANCLFAVKTNPEAVVLTHLYHAGIRRFDVASIDEVAHVRRLFHDAELYFMHPVKPRHAIRRAYFEFGVRHFSLDSERELEKILQETDFAQDLTLHVRLSIPNTYAELTLAEKFGCNLQEAPQLIKKVSEKVARVGVCFHAGSQCMHPDAYRIAIRMVAEVVEQSEVQLDFFNVGGGFPSIYPGMIPPYMEDYFEAIHHEFARIPHHDKMTLLAEPGRALVAECMSLIVRVELRKGNMLYINDGTYGSLFDAGTPRFIYPVKLICDEEIYSRDLAAFSFYGPTCDSLDYMKGPFYLPNDTEEGDFIEIGQMGAYGRTMATRFNGFHPSDTLVYVKDEPLMTMYRDDEEISDEQLEIIAA
ncbi:MAG: type III PLP-dependent enzyme [Alphaproteobacteria bacterium]|nr:MAG: type III PLP-dependent enzyme [Alphaproteobacteria bacterium]